MKHSNFSSCWQTSCNTIAGQAMAEFVIIAITFLFVLLGVIQLALVINAQSLVRYAAYNSARSGIVHSGNLDKMHEAARMSLLAIFPRHGRADHLRGLTDNYVASRATDQDPSMTFFGEPITQVSIEGKDFLSCNESVTFDDPRSASESYITVKVVHHYELVMPLVRRILFWVYMRFRQNNPWDDDATLDQLSSITHKERQVSGALHDIEYRIPLVAHYTMHMQSDLIPPHCQ